MTKQKIKMKSKNQSKSKIYKIAAGIVLLTFIALVLTDLFTKTKTVPVNINEIRQSDMYKFKKEGELSFQSNSGNYISTINIEFADNDIERANGLMLRTELEENQGMLFIFPTQTFQSFWMKNTILSLDMIFINSDLEIVTIHKNTEPYATTSYPSSAPAQYVLETIAGYTDKYNVKVGDKVIFRKTN
jgi:uncharacterized membrane protein (UPF0127 family)